MCVSENRFWELFDSTMYNCLQVGHPFIRFESAEDKSEETPASQEVDVDEEKSEETVVSSQASTVAVASQEVDVHEEKSEESTVCREVQIDEVKYEESTVCREVVKNNEKFEETTTCREDTKSETLEEARIGQENYGDEVNAEKTTSWIKESSKFDEND